MASYKWGFILRPIVQAILYLGDWMCWLLSVSGPMRLGAQYFSGLESKPCDATGARRKTGVTELTTTPDPGCSTLHELMQRSFADNGPLRALGTREYLGLYPVEEAGRPRKVFGATTWKTYAEIGDETAAFGRGLRALGLEPLQEECSQACTESFEQLFGPHALLIFEDTCAVWMTAAIGAMTQSMPVATSYATLGLPAVAEVLNDTAAPAVMCNYKTCGQCAALSGGACPALKVIIYTRLNTDNDAPSLSETIGAGDKKVTVISFDEVVALGRRTPHAGIAFSPPTAESLALIMYTSGSTGKPKGVMITHRNVVAALGALQDYFREIPASSTDHGAKETYLAYLPCAHILEFAMEIGMLVMGHAVGFSDPKTISNKGAVRKRPDGTLNVSASSHGAFPAGGIQEFAPTIMAGVPKIYDALKKGVEKEVASMSPLMQAVFGAAFTARSNALQQGRSAPLSSLAFKATAGALGGRLKLCFSGGGPISAEVQNFVRVAFNVNLVQGYGLTETCAVGTVQRPNSYADGIVGAPNTADEVRLVSCLDALGAILVRDRDGVPYLSTDTRHLGTRCLGRGEIWIRGPTVVPGYYMDEHKTLTDFDEHGWFHTGDIGIWTTSGCLQIVDRLKNLVKLKGGEYVAIEFMEATYAQSFFVNGSNGGVMCYADGDMDRPVALVQVAGKELESWAREHNVQFASLEELCKDPLAIQMVTKDLNDIGKRAHLGCNEALASVALLPGTADVNSTGPDAPWTVENGFLTPSNKLARKNIEAGFVYTLNNAKAEAT